MKTNLDWSQVEVALKEGTFSGYKVAIIETDKILANLLKDKKYPGKTPAKRLKNAWPIFSRPDRLKYARTMYLKILFEDNFDLSPEDTRDIISSYYEAITDLLDVKKATISGKEKIKLFCKHHFPQPSKTTKRVIIGSLIFCIIVLFLAKTSIGQGLSKIIIAISHFIIFKLLLIILLFAAIAGIIIGAVYLIKKRRK